MKLVNNDLIGVPPQCSGSRSPRGSTPPPNNNSGAAQSRHLSREEDNHGGFPMMPEVRQDMLNHLDLLLQTSHDVTPHRTAPHHIIHRHMHTLIIITPRTIHPFLRQRRAPGRAINRTGPIITPQLIRTAGITQSIIRHTIQTKTGSSIIMLSCRITYTLLLITTGIV